MLLLLPWTTWEQFTLLLKKVIQKSQDNETGNVKRKSDEVEITGNLSGPKKAKVALNHLLGADDDAQAEENL